MALTLPQLASVACPNGATTNYINATVGNACFTTGTTYECDATGASAGATINIVEDYEADGSWEAWGTIDGVDFCHDQTFGSINLIVIRGTTQYSDTLRLTDVGQLYRLAPGTTAITAEVFGLGVTDLILGSFYTGADYGETLWGGAGDDIINGRAGDDDIYGEAGSDTLIGGDGNDSIFGGTDHDEIQGGAGDDTIYGDAAGDFISGNDGDDIIDGGGGGDVICGNAHGVNGDRLYDGDSVDDGAQDDKLWGGENSTDDVSCGHTSTQVDPNSSRLGFCSGTYLSSAPTQCP